MHWEKSQSVSCCNCYASSRRFLCFIDHIPCCLTSHCKHIFKASSTISLKDHCLSLSAAITGLKPTHIFQLFHHTVRYEVYLHELTRGCRQFSFSLSPCPRLYLNSMSTSVAFSFLWDLALALEMSIRRSLVQKSVFRLSFTIESRFPFSSCLSTFPLPPLLRPCLIYLSDNQLETPLGPIILAPSIKIGANCRHVFCTEIEMENVSKWQMCRICSRLIRLPHP